MGEANITINSTIEYIKNNTFNMIKEGENVENIQSLNLQNQTESQRNFYTIVFLIITLALIIKKLLKKQKEKVNKTNMIIIGPSNSGKTTFFYSLILDKQTPEKINTVTSMEINELKNFSSKFTNNETINVIDIPGHGFYKIKIAEFLPTAKMFLIFIDSSDKQNVLLASEYIYDILNSDQFNEDVPLIIACNKQDSKYPKSKKIIELELNNEIENIKNIKQKNNLDEDAAQIGTLFAMKGKFSMTAFKNIKFVECDKTSDFVNLKEMIKSYNLSEIY